MAAFRRTRPTAHRRRAFTVCALALPILPTLSQAAAPDEEVWQQWVEWLPTVPATDSPVSLFERHRAALVSAGVTDAEAQRRIVVIQRLMRTRTEGWRAMFNNIYSSDRVGFSVKPNALLVAAVEGRAPGRALDVAMGQGRNAVFLALKGWAVTGFDVSDTGLEIARRNAAQAGASLHAVLSSDAGFDFGTDRWDLVVLAYAPVPLTRPEYVARLRGALRPGGLVVVESFASDAAAPARRPVDIDPAQLRSAFGDFVVHRMEDTVAQADWGEAPTRLARMVAERPR